MSSSDAPFEKLRVWRDAMALAVTIYRATDNFPGSERFGITSQLRRASVSISTNIAEGQGRLGRRQFAAFIDIAIGSAREVESLLCVSHQLGFLDKSEVNALRRQTSLVAASLIQLVRWIRAKGRTSKPS
jgi:four helix bundle protein